MVKSYVDPATVLSPRTSVKNVEVLYDGGAGSFSLAKLQWDGKAAHGLRWNGFTDAKTGTLHKGSPISTGYPVWLILPTEVVQAMDFEKIISRQTLNQRVITDIKRMVEEKKSEDSDAFALVYEADARGIDGNVLQEIRDALASEKISLVSVKERGENTIFNVAFS
ncbi:hypothetical protein PZ739_13200 [Pseudomonas kermanshahensis]|uniref:hypothetical protein n=1 Tax=Pseudomonas kermanshahensis TaxID=2745482 RepID=UPI0023DB908E|nr:hypothetical protein [Pseudomonas kermanshahensis]WEL58069.1 hypothetical protein PZ739_13200 [Pseudomonas kermanshahensis]